MEAGGVIQNYEAASKEIVRLLQSELAEIQVKRPGYSLRAFARLLQVTPTQISEVLKGQRKITRKIASRVLEKLDLDADAVSGLVERLPAKQVRRKRRAGKLDARSAHSSESPVRNYVQLSSDEFRMISDWYCFAILSLAETRGFKSNVSWIAERLGIRERDVRSAVEILLRLGLLKREEGMLLVTGKQFVTTNDVPSSSIRKNHSQGLDQAKEALNEVAVELREITASVVAIDPRLLPVAKARLREIKREITEILEGGEKQEVYRLNIQLFPLTRNKKAKDWWKLAAAGPAGSALTASGIKKGAK